MEAFSSHQQTLWLECSLLRLEFTMPARSDRPSLVLIASIVLASCAGSSSTKAAAPTDSPETDLPHWAEEYEPAVQRDLMRARAATEAFHNIEEAHKAGYPTTIPKCLEHPTDGGMGLHFQKNALLDNQLDVEQPEILVYAPTAEGQLRLVGVEYIIPIPSWTEQEPPTIFGQELKRSAQLNIWYLHVWNWEHNTQGLFADWNPVVKCGDATSMQANP